MKLTAKGISKQFLRQREGSNVFYAVQETDFALEEGRLTVITGRSGGGKSTLLNMLSGLLSPTSGSILADETDLYSLEDTALSAFRNQHFGMIPQGQTAIFSLTVEENILLPLTIYGLQKKDPAAYEAAKAYAKELMAMTDIADLGPVMPSELSGGEMRRMAIARALIRHPDVVFADEPTGDLDDKNTQIILQLLKQIAEQGTAVLLVTHEKAALDYADILYRMDAGQLTPGQAAAETD